MHFIKLLLASSLLLNCTLYADDGFDEDDGFEEVQEIAIEKVNNKQENDFTFYGSTSYSWNYSYVNLNKTTSSKLSSDLNIEYKFNKEYKLKSTIKAYKDFKSNITNDHDIDVNELYIQGTLSHNTDIKIGRQIIVWGKSDNIRITDILNPLDMTTPGMVDIKDLRLARTMSKLDYFINDWTLSGIILHENRYSDMPKFGSEYTTPNKILYNKMQIQEPSNSIKNNGIAISLSGNLQGQDIAFYAANQFVDNTTYKTNMAGFAYNIVHDSFLYKTELAYFDNYDSQTIPSKIDSLVGIEYTGISDGSISFELANKDKTIQYALRFSQSYINQTLNFTTLLSGYGKNCEDGGFIRSWFDYDYDDDIKVTFGVIDYKGGENKKLNFIKDNDKIFGSIKYSF